MESDLLGVGVIDLEVEVTLFGFGIWRLSCMSCLLLLHSRCVQRNQIGHLSCLSRLTCQGSLSISFLTGGLATIHFIRPARLDD